MGTGERVRAVCRWSPARFTFGRRQDRSAPGSVPVIPSGAGPQGWRRSPAGPPARAGGPAGRRRAPSCLAAGRTRASASLPLCPEARRSGHTPAFRPGCGPHAPPSCRSSDRPWSRVRLMDPSMLTDAGSRGGVDPCLRHFCDRSRQSHRPRCDPFRRDHRFQLLPRQRSHRKIIRAIWRNSIRAPPPPAPRRPAPARLQCRRQRS
jgi:hypothetical protein